MGQGRSVITPCGGCRQQLREFAADDMQVHLCGPDGRAPHRHPGRAAADVLRPAAPRHDARSTPSRARRAGFSAARSRVVLGSGLGGFAEEVETRRDASPTPSCRAFRRPTSPAMPAASCSGTSAARRSRVLQGRAHYYEHGRADVMKPVIRTLAAARLRDAAPDQRRRQPAARHAAGQRDGDHRPHQLHRRQSPLFGETGNEPLRRHGRCLRPGAARPRCIARAGEDAARGHLYLVLRPELRDAGRDPRRPRARRRCGRHVDGARDDPGAPCRAEGRGAVADDQLRRRHERRTSSATPRRCAVAQRSGGKVRAAVAALPRRLL